MKYFYSLLIFSFLISCNQSNKDEEEFDYYEPIIGEEFQTVSDQTKEVEYNYNNNKDLHVETEDSNGFKYSMVIPASALSLNYSQQISGSIAPLSDIQNLPEGVDFLFGVEIEPYGESFIKPVKITIELPDNFDSQNLRGFYNQGFGGMAYLEPLKIKRSSGSTQAIFEVLHFSSYGGILVEENNFDCPDPRSAQTCENLREIVACVSGVHEVGVNEKLNPQDQNAVNNVLKVWMENLLKYADGNSLDYSDLYEFEYELRQYICWKSMTQEFNSLPEADAVFGSLYTQAEEYIIAVIADIMEEANTLCIEDLNISDKCLTGTSRDLTKSYLQWLAVAQELGIDDDPRIIGMFEFCNNSLTNLLENFTIVQAGSLIEIPRSSDNESYKTYVIELEFPSQTVPVNYLMTNLLDEAVEISESSITWLETSDWEDDKKPYFYNNGVISMNSELKKLISMCNDIECPDYFMGEFKVYKDDCFMADVAVIYNLD